MSKFREYRWMRLGACLFSVIFATQAWEDPPSSARPECKGVTRLMIETDIIAARTAYDEMGEAVAQMQRAEAGQPDTSGLQQWQIRGLRTHGASLVSRGHQLYERHGVNNRSERYAGYTAEYFLNLRKANGAWTSHFDASWSRLQIPESNPLRRRIDEAFRVMRQSSYRVMRRVGCLSETIAFGSVNSQADTTEVPAPAEAPAPAETPSVPAASAQ